jgi:hypothetical protein
VADDEGDVSKSGSTATTQSYAEIRKMAKIPVAIIGASGETGTSILNGLVRDGNFVRLHYTLNPPYPTTLTTPTQLP